jgi:hypothetical protein
MYLIEKWQMDSRFLPLAEAIWQLVAKNMQSQELLFDLVFSKILDSIALVWKMNWCCWNQ